MNKTTAQHFARTCKDAGIPIEVTKELWSIAREAAKASYDAGFREGSANNKHQRAPDPLAGLGDIGWGLK